MSSNLPFDAADIIRARKPGFAPRVALILGARLVTAVALGLLGLAMVYLFKSTKARNPDQNKIALIASISGAVLAVIAGVVAAAPGTPTAPWWLVAAGGALGAAAHLANVAPDIEDDLATGVRGLPHRLGPVPSAITCAVLAILCFVLLLGLRPVPESPDPCPTR